jgi:hypothetical protein
MMILCIVGAIALFLLFLGIMVLIAKRGPAKEQGPMPKRHGSFGQPVHGGKS